MNLKDLKATKRQDLKNIRSQVPKNIKEIIFKEVKKVIFDLHSKRKEPGYIGIYFPLSGEIDLLGLKLFPDLKLALPACINKNEINYRPWNLSPLKKDFAGIPAPLDEKPLKSNEIELLLVPALGIDKQGYRIGYGGGYFDILRSNLIWGKVPALIVIPESCISTQLLPREEWDIPFNGWISEQGRTTIRSNN